MPESSVAFDHLIHWVDDLDAAMAAYDDLGLPTETALTMPGFRNAAWGIDDERYVELAAVDDWQAARESKYARGLEVLKPTIDALSGAGLVTFAVDVPDSVPTAARLRAAGHDVIEDHVHFEDQGVGFVEVHVLDSPPWVPFFIPYDPPRAELARLRAEHRAAVGTSISGGPELVALLVGSTTPEADAHRLAELIGCSADGATVTLSGAAVRFERGGRAGLYGIVVRGIDLAGGSAEVAGMTVRVEG